MNWHQLNAFERRRLARLELVAEGMTDISWPSTAAKKIFKAAAKAGYASMQAVIDAEYRKRAKQECPSCNRVQMRKGARLVPIELNKAGICPACQSAKDEMES